MIDLSGLLADLAVEDERFGALHGLFDALVYGGEVTEATEAAVPGLLRLLDLPWADEILELLVHIAHGSREGALGARVHQRVLEGGPALAALLQRPEPGVRRGALLCLAACDGAHLDEIRATLTSDDHVGVRAIAALVLARLGDRELPDDPHPLVALAVALARRAVLLPGDAHIFCGLLDTLGEDGTLAIGTLASVVGRQPRALARLATWLAAVDAFDVEGWQQGWGVVAEAFDPGALGRPASELMGWQREVLVKLLAAPSPWTVDRFGTDLQALGLAGAEADPRAATAAYLGVPDTEPSTVPWKLGADDRVPPTAEHMALALAVGQALIDAGFKEAASVRSLLEGGLAVHPPALGVYRGRQARIELSLRFRVSGAEGELPHLRMVVAGEGTDAFLAFRLLLGDADAIVRTVAQHADALALGDLNALVGDLLEEGVAVLFEHEDELVELSPK